MKTEFKTGDRVRIKSNRLIDKCLLKNDVVVISALYAKGGYGVTHGDRYVSGIRK